MGEEEGRVTIIRLPDVRGTAALVLRLGALLCLVAGATTIEAEVIAVGLVVTTGASYLSSLPAALAITSLGAFPLLLPPATRTSTRLATGRSRAARTTRVLLLLARQPLLLHEHELVATDTGSCAGSSSTVFNLLRTSMVSFWKSSSVSMAILSWAYFLGMARRSFSTVRSSSRFLSPWRIICCFNVARRRAKSSICSLGRKEVFPLLAPPLQRGSADVVDTDACRGDGVPRLLGGELVRERHLHLRRNSDGDGLQRAPIVVIREITVPNGVLELARLHL